MLLFDFLRPLTLTPTVLLPSITTQTEHKCVLDSCRILQDEGFDVTYLPVKTNGLIDLELLESSIRPDTCLVSVSWPTAAPFLGKISQRELTPPPGIR